MTPLKIAPNLTVSKQLKTADFGALAAQGVRLIINNRPDGEEPNQLSAADASRLAAEHGMAYRHLPVTMASISAADADTFGRLVAEAVGPVHAHCRSGQRSATLWMLDQVRSSHMTRDQAQAQLTAVGLDPKPAVAWLDQHRDQA